MNPKKILLTGASRGIGYEVALLLASKGHTVICVARNSEKLTELHGKYPQNVIPFTVDLTKINDINRLLNELKSSFNSIDIIIHNAGGITVKPFSELTDDDWNYNIDINLMSAVRLLRGSLPLLNSGAHLVTVSSMGGFQGSTKFPGLSAYSVSKGALAILTECLATELSHLNISVNCLCLGAVQTEMLATAFPGFEAPLSASEMAEYITDFGLNGHRFYNGKILPVALKDPK